MPADIGTPWFKHAGFGQEAPRFSQRYALNRATSSATPKLLLSSNGLLAQETQQSGCAANSSTLLACQPVLGAGGRGRRLGPMLPLLEPRWHPVIGASWVLAEIDLDIVNLRGILASEGETVGLTGDGAAAPEISSEIKMPCKLLNLQGILVNHNLFFNRLSNPLGSRPAGFLFCIESNKANRRRMTIYS